MKSRVRILIIKSNNDQWEQYFKLKSLFIILWSTLLVNLLHYLNHSKSLILKVPEIQLKSQKFSNKSVKSAIENSTVGKFGCIKYDSGDTFEYHSSAGIVGRVST